MPATRSSDCKRRRSLSVGLVSDHSKVLVWLPDQMISIDFFFFKEKKIKAAAVFSCQYSQDGQFGSISAEFRAKIK